MSTHLPVVHFLYDWLERAQSPWAGGPGEKQAEPARKQCSSTAPACRLLPDSLLMTDYCLKVWANDPLLPKLLLVLVLCHSTRNTSWDRSWYRVLGYFGDRLDRVYWGGLWCHCLCAGTVVECWELHGPLCGSWEDQDALRNKYKRWRSGLWGFRGQFCESLKEPAGTFSI